MIDSDLLNSIAQHVNSRVDKVVINGSFVITDFVVKAVTDNVMALNYIVPAAEVSLITMIELKDMSNKVLTSRPVNVPVVADLMMLQTITVKEV
ncbi:ketopantoate hydroxymethyltransferase [Paenibacillus pinisoli]|uniref:Ketopantoate hydroxymethyltransferase n=1 Tax=Paenibacillus pinisoli TaxID=1276110 RepID=A0A3A6PKH4_9BACL|nr:ketopantoate hydroxymethyltransferase [Paenibacillus pinisoli]RJX40860.1 ketopantoate hydroxymethyltransferase [Paenibacillus pinisoli]